MNKKKRLISIIGPTAVGKTEISIELARIFRTEIISSDSRQIYKELELGTAKPSDEQTQLIKHHFVNSHSIHDPFDAGKFEKEAIKIINGLFTRNKEVIMVGGTGLYCKAIWEGFNNIPRVPQEIRIKLQDEYKILGIEPLQLELQTKDPLSHARIDLKNPQRLIRALEVIRYTKRPLSEFLQIPSVPKRPFYNIKIGINLPRKQLYERIDQRVDKMIRNGLINEAASMEEFKHLNALQTVGYKEIFPYLNEEYDFEELVRLIKRNTRRYAKRQLTWFNKDQSIKWVLPNQIDLIKQHLLQA